MRKHLPAAVIALAIVLTPVFAHAELVYQPPSSQNLDDQWRSAGAKLFEGVARINEALAALELKNRPLADQKLAEALVALKSSTGSYEGIVGKLDKPRTVSPVSSQVQLLFNSFKLPIPANEKDAASLAMRETGILLKFVDANREKILKSDVVTVRDLLIAVNRLQSVGTHTAELMLTAK